MENFRQFVESNLRQENPIEKYIPNLLYFYELVSKPPFNYEWYHRGNKLIEYFTDIGFKSSLMEDLAIRKFKNSTGQLNGFSKFAITLDWVKYSRFPPHCRMALEIPFIESHTRQEMYWRLRDTLQQARNLTHKWRGDEEDVLHLDRDKMIPIHIRNLYNEVVHCMNRTTIEIDVAQKEDHFKNFIHRNVAAFGNTFKVFDALGEIKDDNNQKEVLKLTLIPIVNLISPTDITVREIIELFNLLEIPFDTSDVDDRLMMDML